METEFGVYQLTGQTHAACEDRYRVLGSGVQIVDRAERGFVFAVMDGVGDTLLGMQAANEIAVRLTDFYRHPDQYPPSSDGLKKLINEPHLRLECAAAGGRPTCWSIRPDSALD